MKLGQITVSILLITVSILLPIPALGQEKVERITDGITYFEYSIPVGPKVVQVLAINRQNDNTDLEVVLGGKQILGIEPLDRILLDFNEQGRIPAAAVNADFYLLKKDPFQGDPTGLCIIGGEMVSSPVNRSVFVQYTNGTIGIERFRLESRIKDKDLKIYEIEGVNQRCGENGIVILNTLFSPFSRAQRGSSQAAAKLKEGRFTSEGSFTLEVTEKMENDSILLIPENGIVLTGLGNGAEYINGLSVGERIKLEFDLIPGIGNIDIAVGGTPRLIRGGKISIEYELENVRQSFVDNRHPRTAIGFNEENIFLVTVDGRQPGYSIGMSLHELADFMQVLGCSEAMNLDGGGSTTMWIRGEIRNRPSDGNVRPIANAIVVFSRKPEKKY